MQISGTFPELSDNVKLKKSRKPHLPPAEDFTPASEPRSPMQGRGSDLIRPRTPPSSHTNRAASRRGRSGSGY